MVQVLGLPSGTESAAGALRCMGRLVLIGDLCGLRGFRVPDVSGELKDVILLERHCCWYLPRANGVVRTPRVTSLRQCRHMRMTSCSET
jgi:hypothetical protein